MSRSQDVGKTDPDSIAMPPPPLPNQHPSQPIILEPELQALPTCLKNAVIKTGQIYAFYADRERLQHPYKPPNSLVASLGREVEKYDQLCDSIESRLLRAIAVLKRDLKREEQRKKDAAALAAAKTRATDALRPAETIADIDAPAVPTSSPVATSAGPGRRPSAISISSLQRPTAPPKLDLSAASLRMPEDPALFSGGLASPVTLAPKSARPLGPNEFPPDFMAALASASATNASSRAVDIDLTVDDSNMPMNLDPAAGSSADKPIELDLDIDMVELFGDAGGHDESTDTKTTMDGLFTTPNNNIGSTEKNQKEDGSFLASLAGDNDTNVIFSNGPKPASTASHQVPLLPDFSSSDQSGDPGTSMNTNVNANSGGTQSFDITSLDLSTLSPSFFSNTGDSDMSFTMDDFMSMGGNTGEAKDSSTNT